ncbi:MAG: hypothetical protein JNM56_24005 [Planctomycetia bacterium]|nr:hypothetical protein [Planctomycetia bacterium]
MTYRTVEAILQPDGKLDLPASELPSKPVRVMVTVLDDPDAALTELGDYADQLSEYEAKLVRGEIRWQ